ncbi:MAG: NUDIX hydrolase [Burkholderiales bacterium]|nr:NUDIX hydrolase [Burkholderiales bacterium]
MAVNDATPAAAAAPGTAERHLAEDFVFGEEIFKGRLLHVVRDTVRLPNGHAATREYIKHPGAACIVAEFEDGRLLLERQYRYPLGRVMVEFPAGKLDRNENPLVAAQRELKEETGYWARAWYTLGEMHPVIAYSDEVIHLFHASGLVAGEARLDQDEFLELFAATPEEVAAMIADGRITDGKTITAFCRWQLLRRTNAL